MNKRTSTHKSSRDINPQGFQGNELRFRAKSVNTQNTFREAKAPVSNRTNIFKDLVGLGNSLGDFVETINISTDRDEKREETDNQIIYNTEKRKVIEEATEWRNANINKLSPDELKEGEMKFYDNWENTSLQNDGVIARMIKKDKSWHYYRDTKSQQAIKFKADVDLKNTKQLFNSDVDAKSVATFDEYDARVEAVKEFSENIFTEVFTTEGTKYAITRETMHEIYGVKTEEELKAKLSPTQYKMYKDAEDGEASIYINTNQMPDELKGKMSQEVYDELDTTPVTALAKKLKNEGKVITSDAFNLEERIGREDNRLIKDYEVQFRESHRLGKARGIPKDEISKRYAENIARQLIEMGRPDLLEKIFTQVKMQDGTIDKSTDISDESGIALSSLYDVATISKWVNTARSVKLNAPIVKEKEALLLRQTERKKDMLPIYKSMEQISAYTNKLMDDEGRFYDESTLAKLTPQELDKYVQDKDLAVKQINETIVRLKEMSGVHWTTGKEGVERQDKLDLLTAIKSRITNPQISSSVMKEYRQKEANGSLTKEYIYQVLSHLDTKTYNRAYSMLNKLDRKAFTEEMDLYNNNIIAGNNALNAEARKLATIAKGKVNHVSITYDTVLGPKLQEAQMELQILTSEYQVAQTELLLDNDNLYNVQSAEKLRIEFEKKILKFRQDYHDVVTVLDKDKDGNRKLQGPEQTKILLNRIDKKSLEQPDKNVAEIFDEEFQKYKEGKERYDVISNFINNTDLNEEKKIETLRNYQEYLEDKGIDYGKKEKTTVQKAVGDITDAFGRRTGLDSVGEVKDLFTGEKTLGETFGRDVKEVATKASNRIYNLSSASDVMRLFNVLSDSGEAIYDKSGNVIANAKEIKDSFTKAYGEALTGTRNVANAKTKKTINEEYDASNTQVTEAVTEKPLGEPQLFLKAKNAIKKEYVKKDEQDIIKAKRHFDSLMDEKVVARRNGDSFKVRAYELMLEELQKQVLKDDEEYGKKNIYKNEE